jgi:hypothetical protein
VKRHKAVHISKAENFVRVSADPFPNFTHRFLFNFSGLIASEKRGVFISMSAKMFMQLRNSSQDGLPLGVIRIPQRS